MTKSSDTRGLAAVAGAFIASAIMLFLCGCGPSGWAQVEGRVTLDGEPLGSGTVVFLTAGQSSGVGMIGPDGTYTVMTGSRKGMEPGDYRVTVTAFDAPAPTPPGEPPMPPLITPLKYNNVEASGLSAQISAGSNRCDFDLIRDPSS